MSIYEHTDGRSVASAVMLLREDDDSRSILILEGGDDKKVFDELISEDDCVIEVGNGKQNVCDAIKLLNLRSKLYRELDGYLGIVDSDFEEFEAQETCDHTNILKTDGHDLEYMLLDSTALDFLLDGLVERNANDVPLHFKADFKNVLFELGSQFGYLRLKLHRFRKRNGIGYSIGLYERLTVDYMQKLDENHKLSWTAALSCINSITGFSGFSESETSDDEWERLRRTQDKYLCHGKDMLELVLCELLPKMTVDGFGEPVYLSKERARNVLSDAYDMSLFRRTQLHQDIKSWEKQTKFYVLAD